MDEAADVSGVSCGPVSWVYTLEVSIAEMESVSSVVARETRFENGFEKDGTAYADGWGVTSSRVEFLGESWGDSREIERCDAVSPSSSSLLKYSPWTSPSSASSGGRAVAMQSTQLKVTDVTLSVNLYLPPLPLLASCQRQTRSMAKALALAFLSLACCAVAAPSSASSAQVVLSNEPQVGWYDPRDRGGRFLDVRCQISKTLYLIF